MAKKTSYNEKTPSALVSEITTLKASLRALAAQTFANGKNIKEYRITRKNIARAFTALNGTNTASAEIQ